MSQDTRLAVGPEEDLHTAPGTELDSAAGYADIVGLVVREKDTDGLEDQVQGGIVVLEDQEADNIAPVDQEDQTVADNTQVP